jgi:dimethylamine--corrinoid protein Co-methyltransferase
MGKIFSRFGDGSPVYLSESELMQDLEEGTEDAADRGDIPTLSKEELQHLFDIFLSPYRFVSVEPGKEIVLTYDGTPLKMKRAQNRSSR